MIDRIYSTIVLHERVVFKLTVCSTAAFNALGVRSAVDARLTMNWFSFLYKSKQRDLWL